MTYMGVLRSSSVKSCGKWVVSWKMSACSLMGAAAEPDCVFMIPKKKRRRIVRVLLFPLHGTETGGSWGGMG